MKKFTLLSNLLFLVFILSAQATFGVTNYWTGSFNTYWHNNNNWSLGHIPLATEDVVITTEGNIPHVDIYSETVNSLLIDPGATLYIAGFTLTVTNNVTISGTLNMSNSLAKLYCKNILWQSGSTATMTGSALISLSGNWEFAAGANVQLTTGYTDFTGTVGSNIISKDIDCYFNHIRNFKSGTYLAHSSSSTTDVRINGNLYLYSGSILSSFTSLRIKLNGFLNNTAGTGSIQLNNGIFEFTGGSTTNFLNPGDYFYNLLINSTGTTTFADELIIKGYLMIFQGTLNPNNNTIKIGGNWVNSSLGGFTEGTGRVIFNGTGHQYINDNVEFNILEVNKTAGALRVNSATATVYCASYDWTAGAVDILQGTFTAASLADNGIAGSWYLNNGGTINLYNTTGYVDLLGSLYIYGGTMNVYGGIDDSYWPYGTAGSSITMSAGILDFKETGIYVQTTGTLTENITGGSIKTSGNLRLQRADFTPTNNIFTMHGNENAYIRLDAGSINQLNVAKTSAKTFSSTDVIPDYFSSKTEDDLPSPLFDAEYFTNNPVTQTNSNYQIVKQPRDGTKASKVIGDVVTTYANISLNHIIVYSGTLNPNNHTIQLAGDMVILGNLEMTSFWDEINARDFNWYSGSTANVIMGNINVNRDWYFQNGTETQLGGINFVNFIGTVNQYIYNYDANASFKNLNIDKSASQAWIHNLSTDTLRVSGDFTVITNNYFNVQNKQMLVDGNLNIENAASTYILAGGSITGNSTITLFGLLNINQGEVHINGYSEFGIGGELTIDAGTFTIENDINTIVASTVNILNDGIFSLESIFITVDGSINMSSGLIKINGNFEAIFPNNFQPVGGTVEFITENYFNHIRAASNNYLHNLKINCLNPDMEVSLYYPIKIKNDLEIINGKFVGSNPIEIGGNWTNYAADQGFIEGEGTVTFNGHGQQAINNDETFYNLVCNIDTPWPDVMWLEANITATVLNDLNIIDGKFEVNTTSLLDVKRNITIGLGGELESGYFHGTISVGGNWTDNNIENTFDKGFDPGMNSTVIFNGTGQQTITTNTPVEEFINLIIDKPSDTLKSNDNLKISGDFSINQGTMYDNINGLSHEIRGDIYLEATELWRPLLTENTVTFKGTGDQQFNSNNDVIQFYNVIIDKTFAKSDTSKNGQDTSPQVILNSGYLTGNQLNINVGTLFLNQYGVSFTAININDGGTLIADGGSQIGIGASSSLQLYTGGTLEMIGSYGVPVVFRCFNNYLGSSLEVNSGGTISAHYVNFQQLLNPGITIHNGATIDPAHAFNNCNFPSFLGAGPVLSIHSDQILTCDSIYFSANTAGATANVYKAFNLGQITFTNASGYYAGPTFEDDPYSRIDWTGFTPGLWTGVASNYWGDYRNWDNLAVPDATVNVVIPAGVPNFPEVNYLNQFCNNLEISLGASLTIGDNSLSVLGNFVNNGNLTMNNSAGSLNVSQHILWMPNSIANADLGTISVGGDWFSYNGTDSQLGAGNTTVFNGSGNQSIYCYDANASFGTVIIDKPSNAVWIDNYSVDTVRVAGEFTVMANNTFQVQNNQMLINGEIHLNGLSSTNILPGGSITGNADFYLTGSLNINQGDVFLSNIVVFGPAVSDLTIDGGTFTIANNLITPIRHNLHILNNGTFNAHSIEIIPGGSIDMSSGAINLTGNFHSTAYNAFQPTGGSVEFTGQQVSSIYFLFGNYFYDLNINMTSQVHLVSDIGIKNDLNINNGGLYTASHNIEIGGNWNNNVGLPNGFLCDFGTVIFNGDGNNQNVTAETFYNVQQDYVSTGSNLLFLGSTTVLNNMTLNYHAWINDVFDVQGILDINNPTSIFTANNNGNATIAYLAQGGTMNMNGGAVTVNDLVENGIYGSINIVSGELNYYQDAGSFVDLNCNLSMSGGTFNINSSNDNSLWTFDGDASVTMSGGILNFNNCGVLIQDNANTFTENITGGIIRTDGIFRADRSQFTPSGGTIELYGGTDAEITAHPGANFYNLVINKSGGKSASTSYKDRYGNMVKATMGNMAYFNTDVNVHGDFTVGAGELYFIGVTVSCMGNVNINTGGTLSVMTNGTLSIDNLKTLSVNSGGTLSVIGNAGNEAKITHLSGYYNLNIESGGTIAAEHGVFEYMNTNGIYLKPGSIVSPANSFNNCYFREGISGGRLMTVNTEDVFTVNDAVFPTNTWGSTHNVYKSAIIGSNYFVGATGGFAGEDFDYDPYNLIHWSDHVLMMDLNINLEGPFNGTNMNTDLNNLSMLPLTQPYDILPWNYFGPESVSSIPNNQVVDWVLVEGRDAPDAASATETTTFVRQAAFLLSDGSIVGLGGSSPIQFTHNLINQLFIVIMHRNHLPVMSQNPLIESGGIFAYDFTTSASQAYGNNQNNLGGVFVMIGGNGDANSAVDMVDKTSVWMIETGLQGYLSGDFTLDGQVNNQDKNDVWVGNLGKGYPLP